MHSFRSRVAATLPLLGSHVAHPVIRLWPERYHQLQSQVKLAEASQLVVAARSTIVIPRACMLMLVCMLRVESSGASAATGSMGSQGLRKTKRKSFSRGLDSEGWRESAGTGRRTPGNKTSKSVMASIVPVGD